VLDDCVLVHFHVCSVCAMTHSFVCCESFMCAMCQVGNTAKRFNTLQHTATHCNTLHHAGTHCSTLQHTAAHCSTLQYTATLCNTLRHTATLGTAVWSCAVTQLDVHFESFSCAIWWVGCECIHACVYAYMHKYIHT